jgi:hypothetical protein
VHDAIMRWHHALASCAGIMRWQRSGCLLEMVALRQLLQVQQRRVWQQE